MVHVAIETVRRDLIQPELRKDGSFQYIYKTIVPLELEVNAKVKPLH